MKSPERRRVRRLGVQLALVLVLATCGFAIPDMTVAQAVENPLPAEAIAMDGSSADMESDSGSAETTVNIYRVLNPDTQEHLYTSSLNEYTYLTQTAGWEGENVAWTAPEHSSTPIFRLYNPAGGHLYTSSWTEYEYQAMRGGWVAEGICFYGAPKTDAIPVYRLYDPAQPVIGYAHLWTADDNEYTVLHERYGWQQEGVSFYAYRAPGLQ